MISIYQAFKILFGIIVSGFILFFMLHYAGEYGIIQQKTYNLLVMRNFRSVVENVYLTGVPDEFDQFSKSSSDVRFSGSGGLASLVTDEGRIYIYSPVLPSFGEELFLERKSVDYDFFEFKFVEAVPRLSVLFSMDANEDRVWKMAQEIVDNLPDTMDHTPKVTFGFCDGDEVIERMCGDKNCEKNDFLNILRQNRGGVVLQGCRRSPLKQQRVIEISDNCNQGISGICITPPDINGMGFVYISGSSDSFIYKDVTDIIPIIIGGSAKDITDKPMGETLFHYKNNMFRDRASLVSKIMEQRSRMMAQELTERDIQLECISLYMNLVADLSNIQLILTDKNYYKDYSKSLNLKTAFNRAKDIHLLLVERGCDY